MALKKPRSLSEDHQNDLFNFSRECICVFCSTTEKVSYLMQLKFILLSLFSTETLHWIGN